jgi:conserved oligomeric Golgi complex subunit 5
MLESRMESLTRQSSSSGNASGGTAADATKVSSNARKTSIASTRGSTANPTASSSSSAAQAATSLALLLREDQLLTKYNMHINASNKRGENEQDAMDPAAYKGKEDASFSYAAALLLEDDMDTNRIHSTSTYSVKDHQQRAEDALGEVERKLALVESLAERVSRTSPEAVAGPLLRLHGHAIVIEEDEKEGEEKDPSPSSLSSSTQGTTLVATRERCDRLKRQGEVLEGVATRVETSLTRGLTRMDKATNRLSRVLQVSATLKMILRLQFEASKLEGFILDDLRDLTRAAASVAVIEDLLSKPELRDHKSNKIDVVDAIRPQATKTAAAVRKAAADLLSQRQQESESTNAIIQLGATLQVYYHLGELPQAAWSAVNHALAAAEKVSNEFWSPTTLTNLQETATTEAKLSAASKKLSDANVQRALKNKLKEFRADAAIKWANGITDAALQVWNLQQVLSRKTDPVSRQVFMDVVAKAPIPEKFRKDYEELIKVQKQSINTGKNAGNENDVVSKKENFSIFSLFWERLCQRMGDRLKHILEYENGKFAPDVSALYPAVRSAILHSMASLKDTMQAAGMPGSSLMASLDDTASSSSAFMGVLGGSAALDDPFLRWSSQVVERDHDVGSATSSSRVSCSADRWTVSKSETGNECGTSTSGVGSGSTTASMSAVFSSPEWQTLEGNQTTQKGLFRLQIAFLQESSDRLCAPLKYMFAENVTIDDTGNAISHLPLLPSKYDIQRLDGIIRQELAIADPREGGGDLSSVSMIAENIVHMISRFCAQAENAVSNVGEKNCLSSDGSPTDALAHDLKVAKIVHFMAECLRTAPEKVFLDPYRPALTSQLEEASNVASLALLPAREEIDNLVTTTILRPLCRAVNQRIATKMGRMHQEGAYLPHGIGDSSDMSGSSFVQKHMTGLYESLSATYLAKLPPRYSILVGSTVAVFSVFTFVSNASLIRPLSEDAKLHLTQDLADFELVIDQFVTRSGGNVETKSLSEIGNGKAYAELRAMRQMLFWTGLDDTSKPPSTVAKSILRENWVRDVRPSTLFHYLFSFAPNLLSSPHHWKRMRAEEYVGTLVSLDGEVEEGESVDWMTTMQCCDSYQQRESAQSSLIGKTGSEGDPRIASILSVLGPELLRRRR